ncbi:hypothetical protein HCN50_00670 [Bradyrhizobium sp. WSM 1744]|uniref:Uncharacterized protein n=1 Tax=Bradyrhizobium archetypum TaxID=2721160 RepID=A0A7Y4GZC1_9BRAD|nr:hypothetical protein [Bradyrhizobium archetypum]
MDKPPLVKGNLDFLKLPLGKETFYLTPDAILVTAGKTVAAFGYGDVEFTVRGARFIEEETPPADATVVDQTWRYVNRKGGPDRRFNNNRQLPICLYGEIDFRSVSGVNKRIQCSRVHREFCRDARCNVILTVRSCPVRYVVATSRVVSPVFQRALRAHRPKRPSLTLLLRAPDKTLPEIGADAPAHSFGMRQSLLPGATDSPQASSSSLTSSGWRSRIVMSWTVGPLGSTYLLGAPDDLGDAGAIETKGRRAA